MITLPTYSSGIDDVRKKQNTYTDKDTHSGHRPTTKVAAGRGQLSPTAHLLLIRSRRQPLVLIIRVNAFPWLSYPVSRYRDDAIASSAARPHVRFHPTAHFPLIIFVRRLARARSRVAIVSSPINPIEFIYYRMRTIVAHQ
jgi:hypothetical protein